MIPHRLRAVTILLAFVVAPRALTAQLGISVGAGVGITGSTDESLSNGHGGWIVSGAVTSSLLPIINIGAELDYLRSGSVNAQFLTGLLEAHLPATPISLKLGAGYGRADLSDQRGTLNGPAIQIGATWGIGLPVLPLGVDLFANAYLAHGSARYAQMVDGGVSIRWR